MNDQRTRVGKEKILEQAEKLFTEQGYQAVSIRAIADACGVTNAALYYHFDDKSSLFAEVMKRHTKNLSEHLRRAAEGEDDPEAKLTAMAQAYIHLVSHRRPLMFLVRHRSQELQQGRHKKLLMEMLGDVLKPFDEVFDQAIARGDVRSFPEGYSGASILMGMIHGLNAHCWVRTEHKIAGEDVALLVDYLWNGIRTGSATKPAA